ncbi:hypothetical protein EE612_043185 [Oryza sativa]|nr:hypothetical protein EE612_043185 [Oryza sativa]
MAISPVAAMALAIALAALCLAGLAAGFYLPGVAPNNFDKKDPLQVKVNKLTSIKTQLPYSYYSLPFCKPDTIVNSAQNLGEVLRGDRIENSPYTFEMREPQMRQIVCKISVGEKEAKILKEKIEDEYRVNMQASVTWFLDSKSLFMAAKYSKHSFSQHDS